MKKSEAKNRIKKLREAIRYHRHLYHVLDQQEISDAAHDSLKHELFNLEQQFPDLITSDSPTQRVGGKPLDKFKKVAHKTPMLSMEDVFSIDELSAWHKRISKRYHRPIDDLYLEVKMDGLALSLIYQDGVFVNGATRGDGRTGEDVTANLKTIEAIPLRLRVPDTKEIKVFMRKYSDHLDRKRFDKAVQALRGRIEVRGEVFMTKKNFIKLNQAQDKKGLPPFANPRNAAAGSIRQLDSAVTHERSLDFFGYAIIGDFGLKSHETEHEFMKLIGIKINPLSQLVSDIRHVKKYHLKLQEKRESLPYWTDGVVVVVNDEETFRRLGVVGKAPRGLIAFKFPGEQVTTVVEDIKVQVGRTGALTPVAVMRPAHVAGTMVTHASLHNMDEIDRLELRIGDTVVLEKAGDVIPKVVRVITKVRDGHERKFKMPKDCPVCGSEVTRRQGEVAYHCTNPSCYARSRKNIMHFVSKASADIPGLGGKILEKFLDEGLIADTPDLYQLKHEDISGLEGFGEKSAENLIKAIDNSRSLSLPRFIYGLGIRHVGWQTAVDLSENFRDIGKLRKADIETLSQIENVGEVVAKSVVDFFSDKKNAALVDRLLKEVKIKPYSGGPKGPFTGKVFVVTGSLEEMTRDEAHDRIRAAGGRISSSVSGNVTHLVVGKKPGSKLDKAKKLGLTVLKEHEFKAMLDT